VILCHNGRSTGTVLRLCQTTAAWHARWVGSDRDAYLDQVLVGGREPAVISVVDYDERWPSRFRELAGRVRRALGTEALGVEHIGSTSVPGLAAKPIIDMLLTVADVTDEAAYVPALEATELELRVREPEHRMLRTPARDVHLHVYEPAHAAVRDYLDLRDWLTVDSADRELYAVTKRRLSQHSWRDMNDYADAKSDVIRDVLHRARAWRTSTRSDER
jgi:GrpB-like predicted nucleotidyltransferase (UPF0157 family)